MEERVESMETEIKKRLESSAYSDGRLERMLDRIDKLEDAVAHLYSWISDRERLEPDEIYEEDGLLDF